MNPASWIILAVVTVAVVLAVRSMIKDKKAGKSCSCGCSGCSEGSKDCPSTRMALEMAKGMERELGGGSEKRG